MRWHFYLIQIEYTAQRNDCQTLSQLKPWFRHCMVCWIHYYTTIVQGGCFVTTQYHVVQTSQSENLNFYSVWKLNNKTDKREKSPYKKRMNEIVSVSGKCDAVSMEKSNTKIWYQMGWLRVNFLNYQYVTMKWLQLRPAFSSVNLLSKWSIYFRGTVDFACTGITKELLLWQKKFNVKTQIFPPMVWLAPLLSAYVMT